MSTVNGLGIGISFEGVKNWAAYWAKHLFGQDDLNLWAKDRSGLTIPDTIGANDVSITTPTYRGTATSSLIAPGGEPERVFNGGSYTIYLKVKQLANYSVREYVLRLGQLVGYERGLNVIANANNLSCYFDDTAPGNLKTPVMVTDMDANFLTKGWCEIFIEIDFAAKLLKTTIFKLSDGSPVGTNTSTSIAAFTFNDDDNTDIMSFQGSNYTYKSTIFAYADIKKFSALKTIAQCRDNSYVTDLQFYYPELTSGTDVSGNAHHMTLLALNYTNNYYSDISSYCLDYGYSLYRSIYKSNNFPAAVGYNDIYVPHTTGGVAIARTINDRHPLPYIKVGEFTGSLTKHNMAESMLNIPVSQWDKSDTNIFEDVVRSSVYYDAGNIDNWHISEFDYLLFSQRCKTSHKGLNFFKITDNSLATEDRKYLTEIFSYNTNVTGDDIQKILQYTGDKSIIDGALQLYSTAVADQTVQLYLGGITGEDSIQVYWGDGAKRELIVMNDAEPVNTLNHTYVGASFPIHVINPENLFIVRIASTAFPLTYDISEIGKAINLKTFATTGGPFIGTIDDLPITITDLRLSETNMGGIQFITGDISRFVNLTRCDLFGDNTIYGAFSAPNLASVFIAGMASATLDIGGMTTIVQIEKTNSGGGNYIEGSLNTSLGFKIMCVDAPNDMSANFELLPLSEYLSNGGTPATNWTGDISGLVEIFEIILNPANITGSFTNLVDLQTYSGHCPLLTKPVRFNNNPQLINFLPNSDWVWSSAEVNQLLADVWANRDVDKEHKYFPAYPKTTRHIKLDTVGSGAPTGQGLTDLANLRAYRSPGDDPIYNLWTIDVNS